MTGALSHRSTQQPTKDNHNTQPLLCHRTMDNAPPSSPGEKTIMSSLRRRRHWGRTSTRCRCLTGGGSPRSEGRSNAGHQRGERGIAVAVTAALAQLARLSTRGAREGAALAASYRRVSTLHAGPRWHHGRLRGWRGRDGSGEGGITRGEENGGEGAVIPSLVGLRRH